MLITKGLPVCILVHNKGNYTFIFEFTTQQGQQDMDFF